MSDADVVVVGGGHNGLVCATYLARAGLRVTVVEARASVGGCASTVEAVGARVNVCNCDHLSFRTTPIAEELALDRHGLTYLDVEPAQVSVGWDGSAPWTLHHDPDDTVEALRATHPGEVEGYRRYLRAARPVAELVLELAGTVPSPRTTARAVLARRGTGAATLLRWSRRGAASVLRDFFSTDALVGPALTTGPAVWGVPGDRPGTGLAATGYALKHVARLGRPRGGSGALPDALAGALVAAGATLRTNARVNRLLAETTGIRAVQLDGGETIEAPTVVVACDPRRALLEWLRSPPPGARATIRRWARTAQPEGYESKIDAVVESPPTFEGYDGALVPTVVVFGSPAALEEAHAAAGRGMIASRPPMLCNVPSVLDPSMTTPDGHVLSLEVLTTPYSLSGGWPGSREPERWLRAVSTLSPGLLDSVRRWRVVTPIDYELDFSLVRGHAPSFTGGPLAALLGRSPELTRYRTPVPGLYLTGAATFPGAGVWGASGRNTAGVVTQDLERAGRRSG